MSIFVGGFEFKRTMDDSRWMIPDPRFCRNSDPSDGDDFYRSGASILPAWLQRSHPPRGNPSSKRFGAVPRSEVFEFHRLDWSLEMSCEAQVYTWRFSVFQRWWYNRLTLWKWWFNQENIKTTVGWTWLIYICINIAISSRYHVNWGFAI